MTMNNSGSRSPIEEDMESQNEGNGESQNGNTAAYTGNMMHIRTINKQSPKDVDAQGGVDLPYIVKTRAHFRGTSSALGESTALRSRLRYLTDDRRSRVPKILQQVSPCQVIARC